MIAKDIKNKGIETNWMCIMTKEGYLHNVYYQDSHVLYFTFAYDEKNILIKHHWETIQFNLREF